MKNEALKEYLHSIKIGKKEVIFIRKWLLENSESLINILPKNNSIHKYFLSDLLKNALKDYKDNISLVNEILTLKDQNNEEYLYRELLNNKDGIELIKNNENIQNHNKDKTFEDIFKNGSIKSIIEYLSNNKKDIDIEKIYTYGYIKLGLIEALEKQGMIFDERIIKNIGTIENFQSPKRILKYIEKYENKLQPKVWDDLIIKMLNYYNKEIWDFNGKYVYKDSFLLIMKLKEPSKFKWGEGNFTFNDCINFYFKPPSKNDMYIDINNMNNKEQKKNLNLFMKNNVIYFENLIYNKIILDYFIDVIPQEVINEAINNNWSTMFDFNLTNNKERKYLNNINEPFFSYSSLGDNGDKLLTHPKIRNEIFNNYVNNPKWRLKEWQEKALFEKIGFSKEGIKKEIFLEKNKSLINMKSLGEISRIFSLDRNTIKEIEKEWLSKVLYKEEESQKIIRKIKI